MSGAGCKWHRLVSTCNANEAFPAAPHILQWAQLS